MQNDILKTAQKDLWHGYDSYRFELDGAECIIIKADSPLKGNPWIWRARFFHAEHSLDLAMLRRGVHLVHIDTAGLAGGPEAIKRMDKFYEFLTGSLKFSLYPILESYSRGAFPALNWGIRNPEKPAILVMQEPICNLESWPGTPGEYELCRNAGVLTDKNEIISEWNPVEHLPELRNIPVAVIYEKNDPVSAEKNAEKLISGLQTEQNPCILIYKEPVSSDDIEELADYALAAWKEKNSK